MKAAYNTLEEDVHLDHDSVNSITFNAENDKRAIDNPKLNRDNNNPHDKDRDYEDNEDDDDFLDDGFDDDDSLTDDEEYDDDPQETKRNQKRTGTDTNP